MLPIAWITCCFLLGALVGTINKAGRGPFMVLARRAYSTSISPRTVHPQLAPPIGLPTLTGRVDVSIGPSGSHVVDARATHMPTHLPSYTALYDVYSGSLCGWAPTTSDYCGLVLFVGGVSVLLAILVYLTSSGRHSKQKQKHARADPAVSTADSIPNIPQVCVHPSSTCSSTHRGAVDNLATKTTSADFKRIRAELAQLRKAVDALVAHRSRAEETLHKLNATHEELRGILESINDRTSRDPPAASSSNPWVIPSDHDAFSDSHFSSDTVQAEDTSTAPRPAILDDDSQYLSTALGLTNWSDIPPRNGYYPTLDLPLPSSRSERGSGQEAWWVPSDELRAWIFPRGAQAGPGSCAPARSPDRAFGMPDASEAGGVVQKLRTLDEL